VRKTRVNHEIRLSPINLIDHNNNQVGEIDTREALRMAEEAGLDLVEIQPDVRPPLCKIMDYGKHRYELSKKQKGQKQKANEIKEVRLGRSAKIDPHDVEIRVKQARKFLMEGYKVTLRQRFRGREMAHKHIGIDRLRKICEDLADIAKVEAPPRDVGRDVLVALAPDKPKIEAIKRKLEQQRKAEEQAKAKPAEDEAPKKDAPPAQPPEAKADETPEPTPEERVASNG